MCSSGDCFVVFPPNCAAETVIFGRSSQDDGAVDVAQEIYFYNAAEALEGKNDGGAELETTGDTLRIILQKPQPGFWGGDCGANERNVCMGITWVSDEVEGGSGQLTATDIVRYALAAGNTATEVVERIGALVEAHVAKEQAKYSFVVCDAASAWTVSTAGKLWSAQCFTEGYRRFPCDGLAVTTTIDKSSADLAENLKTLGLWNAEGELDFAAIFGASPAANPVWCGDEPTGDGTYSLTSMFGTLRAGAQTASSRSATVSVLNGPGISSHWFTATPNASESVFKPFVFAPNPRISPLTKVPVGQDVTLLHKLHAQRRQGAVEDLKGLEASCVDEVNNYLAEHPMADEELDELMKDCVEAEVKFYR